VLPATSGFVFEAMKDFNKQRALLTPQKRNRPDVMSVEATS
jgi:hypothetical protein